MLKKTVLNNGLTVLNEKIRGQKSFSLSFTLKSGSCMENQGINGIHHFMEHMIFKGTKKYSQHKIAELSDRLGGNLNAFTAKEITQFYIKSIREKFDISLNLLYDMVFNSD